MYGSRMLLFLVVATLFVNMVTVMGNNMNDEFSSVDTSAPLDGDAKSVMHAKHEIVVKYCVS